MSEKINQNNGPVIRVAGREHTPAFTAGDPESFKGGENLMVEMLRAIVAAGESVAWVVGHFLSKEDDHTS